LSRLAIGARQSHDRQCLFTIEHLIRADEAGQVTIRRELELVAGGHAQVARL
jgi:hypothetical protein